MSTIWPVIENFRGTQPVEAVKTAPGEIETIAPEHAGWAGARGRAVQKRRRRRMLRIATIGYRQIQRVWREVYRTGGSIVLKTYAWAALALMLASAAASADERPVVVELFTSQGCSSCPPADKLLGELAQRPDVLALGFHISYWDHLGWKDPLSSQASTDRQKAYAHRLSGGQIYTPQLVVEGSSEMVGSRRAEVLAALREAHAAVIAPTSFAADRRSLAIGPGRGAGDVLLVRFALHRATQVGAGENAGRALEDTNGVETLKTIGAWTGAKATFTVEPPGPGEGLAVLVQAEDGKILGAAAVKSEPN